MTTAVELMVVLKKLIRIKKNAERHGLPKTGLDSLETTEQPNPEFRQA